MILKKQLTSAKYDAKFYRFESILHITEINEMIVNHYLNVSFLTIFRESLSTIFVIYSHIPILYLYFCLYLL